MTAVIPEVLDLEVDPGVAVPPEGVGDERHRRARGADPAHQVDHRRVEFEVGGQTGEQAPRLDPAARLDERRGEGILEALVVEPADLVLDDLGSRLTVAANGPFTLPGSRADGLPYDVKVTTQPSSPDQVCTVSDGTGTIHGADVGDVAVRCVTPAPPAGLDPTFGSDGRVSTPMGAVASFGGA